MATKSIVKNVDVKDKQLGHALVAALEAATQKKANKAIFAVHIEKLKKRISKVW